jgi:hypothetical protein
LAIFARTLEDGFENGRASEEPAQGLGSAAAPKRRWLLATHLFRPGAG